MKRMKTFFIYALLVVALWIFTDIIIYLAINGTYKPMDTRVYASTPQVVISESKATYVNGVIKGSIKNNTQGIIDNMYLKIDMYSARDNNLGTKYIKIDNLRQNQVRDFEMGYKFTDVNYVTITTTEHIENTTEDQFLSQEASFYFIIGTLMFLYLI